MISPSILLIFTSILLLLKRGHSINLPTGFYDEKVADIQNPTDFAFTPDGRLLILSKPGEVYVVPNPESSKSKELALNFGSRICDEGSRGLGAIAVDPNFKSNNWVYIYWTKKENGSCALSASNGPVNRVSRFVLGNNNKIDFDSEHLILQSEPLPTKAHNHGCLEFGKDGLLYITHGDAQTKDKVQKLNSLFGKVMRVKNDGSIPNSNPYASGSRCNKTGKTNNGKCAEIYARGVRNAFRCFHDPNTSGTKVRFALNDVGSSHWEETSMCDGDECEGGDFGWPGYEGPCEKGIWSGSSKCKPANGQEDPVLFYKHDSKTMEGAITGGAFIPRDLWGSKYNSDKSFLYADYVFSKIYYAKPDPNEGCRNCNSPKPNYDIEVFASDADKVVTMEFGPFENTLALYYIERDTESIRRIVKSGSSSYSTNNKPTAVINADETKGPVGIQIKFDATESFDPDDDGLTYRWDLNGDGTIDSNDEITTYTFDNPGTYKVVLTVTDDNGASDTDTFEIIIVGGSGPKPTIVSPAEGTAFAVGDIFYLEGYATDAEDGNLTNCDLTWEVKRHHANHFHPWHSPAKCDGQFFSCPGPEDFYAATNSHLEIILTATDSHGLEGKTSRIINPRKVQVMFDTIPQNIGLDIHIDDTPLAGPGSATSWLNYNLPIEARNQCIGSTCYKFVRWSDNGPQKHEIVVGESNPVFTAEFEIDNTSANNPGAGVLLLDGEEIITNQLKQALALDVYLEQENNGNLVLHDGTFGMSKGVLWSSNINEPTGEYFTILNRVGKLKTFRKNVDDSSAVWKTPTSTGINGDYFLEVNSNKDRMSIYEGLPSNPNRGDPVWYVDLAPTSSSFSNGCVERYRAGCVLDTDCCDDDSYCDRRFPGGGICKVTKPEQYRLKVLCRANMGGLRRCQER